MYKRKGNFMLTLDIILKIVLIDLVFLVGAYYLIKPFVNFMQKNLVPYKMKHYKLIMWLHKIINLLSLGVVLYINIYFIAKRLYTEKEPLLDTVGYINVLIIFSIITLMFLFRLNTPNIDTNK